MTILLTLLLIDVTLLTSPYMSNAKSLASDVEPQDAAGPSLQDVVPAAIVPPAVKDEGPAAIAIPATPAAPTSVSLPSLFRFSTRSELLLGCLGLLLAVVSGATQPIMTIVFGQLTQSFTNWGILQRQIAASSQPTSPELLQALADAGSGVKSDAARNATYLVIIGIAQGISSYLYMIIWNYVGEANSKRLRQAYLDGVLRQEIAYFDDIGAGEVATRIESDCHLVQDGTSE